MSANGGSDQIGESVQSSGAHTVDTERGQASAGDAASTCGGAPVGEAVGDEEARLNARRLSLVERWRLALGEPSEEDLGAEGRLDGLPVRARREEFWEAREMSDIWAQAERDSALLSMLREEEHDVLGAEPPGAEPVDQASLDGARARFQSRMRQAAEQAARL